MTFPTGKTTRARRRSDDRRTVCRREPDIARRWVSPRACWLRIPVKATTPTKPTGELPSARRSRRTGGARGRRSWSCLAPRSSAWEDPQWDVVPQMQVTLSCRQHIMIDAGSHPCERALDASHQLHDVFPLGLVRRRPAGRVAMMRTAFSTATARGLRFCGRRTRRRRPIERQRLSEEDTPPGAIRVVRGLPGLPQRHAERIRRGRLHRSRLACVDDGELGRDPY